MAGEAHNGRLSFWQAAFVVARRDFVAILFSRAFFFFLLGPLFPLAVAALAGGIGAQVASGVASADVGLAMPASDAERMIAARNELAQRVGSAIPNMLVIETPGKGEDFDARRMLETRDGSLAAIVTGTVAQPQLTAPPDRLARWQGTIALVAGMAQADSALPYPEVTTVATASSGASETRGRLGTAQGGQVLLFLLIMLLASMVLSNLVEEKGNKIIEILAAAIPMNAVFCGKLFAMLAISVVGITVWGSTGALLLTATGVSLSDYAIPGVGWPMFFLLFAVYFAMGYLLLGAIFLTIGSQAATVREVQTYSMPATMAQVLVFFFASLAVTQMGEPLEYAAMAFPLSSPFVMVARAAMDEALWPHLVAIAWQLACVALFIRIGAGMFRKRVLKSGPAKPGKRRFGGLFGTRRAT